MKINFDSSALVENWSLDRVLHLEYNLVSKWRVEFLSTLLLLARLCELIKLWVHAAATHSISYSNSEPLFAWAQLSRKKENSFEWEYYYLVCVCVYGLPNQLIVWKLGINFYMNHACLYA